MKTLNELSPTLRALELYRNERGLTMSEMSAMLNHSHSWYSNSLAGRTSFRPKNLEQQAWKVGIGVDSTV